MKPISPVSNNAPKRATRITACLVVLLLVGACTTGRPLMPAPTLYRAVSSAIPFDKLDPSLATSDVELLYVTDREPETDEAGNVSYGTGRSASLAMGTIEIALGDTTWEELRSDARTAARPKQLNLSVEGWEELVRFPSVPYPYRYENGRFVLPPSLQARLDSDFEVGRDEILERLAKTDRKEVFIYVHGIGNTFEDAAYATAEIWHFLGREGVPILYSWPAGHGGLLRGYTYDRESSEFTLSHFRNFMTGLSRIPEIERINIIAHSRGTDVVSTALSTMFLEARAAGGDARERFRIHNLVLAAPDLDVEVMEQRIASARLAFGVDRLTVYTSKNDRAIGAAMWLFGSTERVGQLEAGELSPQFQAVLAQTANVALITYRGDQSGSYGHTYFRTNPAVASDVVLTLRYDRDPGAENGRPLTPLGPAFWAIDDDYLQGGSDAAPAP